MTEEQREQLSCKIRERTKAKRQRMVPPEPPPRYDDVYFAGSAWLDRIAREDEEGGSCSPQRT